MTEGDDTSIPIQGVVHWVRDEDHAVLACIKDGETTVRAINKATTLTRHQINYAFQKLGEMDLINVRRPDGWTRSQLENGEYRTHRKSKEAELTDRGEQYFEQIDSDEGYDPFVAEDEDALEDAVEVLQEDVDALKEELLKHRRAIKQLHRDGSRSNR